MECRRQPAGLGPEMRPWGLKFPPANPRRWPAARAAGLVWRLRAVPRTHGTRAASGHRPDGYYGPPARSSLTVAQMPREARPDAGLRLTGGGGNRRSGAPRGERVERRAAAQAASGCAFRRSAPLMLLSRGERPHDGVPGAANNTGGGALAFASNCGRSRAVLNVSAGNACRPASRSTRWTAPRSGK